VARLALIWLFRRPVQVLAVAGVAIGLLALLVVLSVMNGLIEIDRANVRGPLSDLLLVPAQEGETLPQWKRYREALAELPEVRALAPHLVAYAMLGLKGGGALYSRDSSSDVNGVQVVGIDPELEERVAGFRRSLESAEVFPLADPEHPFPLPRDDPFARPGLLISAQLAAALGIRRGERIELGALPARLPPADQEMVPVNARFQVVGSYRSGDYRLSMDRLYVLRTGPQGLRRNLLGRESPEFSEILIDLEPGIALTVGKTAVLAALREAGLPVPGGQGGGALQTWEERRGTYLRAIDNERRVTTLVMFFVVVVAAFGLFATLSALVREKVRDLGVLAALGCGPWQRGLLLLITGAGASAIGTLLGYAGARALSVEDRLERFLALFGIQVFRSDLYVVGGLPTRWIPEQARLLALCAFLVGVSFTLAPALRAAFLRPVSALRYE